MHARTGFHPLDGRRVIAAIMMVKVPDTALATPPDTGASMSVIFFSARAAPRLAGNQRLARTHIDEDGAGIGCRRDSVLAQRHFAHHFAVREHLSR